MRKLMVLATALSLGLSGTAFAAQSTASTKTTTTKTAPAKSASAKPGGHMATTTTKSGKKITYDCSKAGNKNKTACKH